MILESKMGEKYNPKDAASLRKHALQIAALLEVPPFPPIVYIEPTNACNLKCIICPRSTMTRKIGSMDISLFDKILDDITELGPSEIRLFNFGEPLLYKDLPLMVKKCNELGLKASFQTNGLLLNKDIMLALLEAGLDYLGVSVNALTEEEYAIIREGNSLVELREKVKLAKTLAKEMNKPLHIHVNAHIIKDDQDARKSDFTKFVAFWHDIADTLSISGISLFDKIEYLKGGTKQKAILKQLPKKPDAEFKCTEPFDRVIIKWDGTATVCCADFDAKYVVGNLAKQSLKEIWHGEAFEAIRKIVKTRNYSLHPLCSDCPNLYSGQFSIVFARNKK